MSGPKEKKKLTGVELARRRQPTGRLLADVLKKSRADIKGKKVDKTVRGPHK
jgi:hypothetical protein